MQIKAQEVQTPESNIDSFQVIDQCRECLKVMGLDEAEKLVANTEINVQIKDVPPNLLDRILYLSRCVRNAEYGQLDYHSSGGAMQSFPCSGSVIHKPSSSREITELYLDKTHRIIVTRKISSPGGLALYTPPPISRYWTATYFEAQEQALIRMPLYKKSAELIKKLIQNDRVGIQIHALNPQQRERIMDESFKTEARIDRTWDNNKLFETKYFNAQEAAKILTDFYILSASMKQILENGKIAYIL